MIAAYIMAILCELEKLLRRRAAHVISAAYAGLVAAICMCDELRTGYFSWAVPLPVALGMLVLPAFALLLVAACLSPSFAGEDERAVADIPACCLMGSRGRNAAKLLAGMVFAAATTLALLAATVGITMATGCGDLNRMVEGIDYYGAAYAELTPVWTVGEHLRLLAVSQPVGAASFAVMVQLISKRSGSPAAAMAVTVFVTLAEFLFRHFGPFPLILTEINVWSLMETYLLFDMSLFHGAPAGNLAMLAAVWAALCAAASVAIVWGRERTSALQKNLSRILAKRGNI